MGYGRVGVRVESSAEIICVEIKDHRVRAYCLPEIAGWPPPLSFYGLMSAGRKTVSRLRLVRAVVRM